jgi:FkbM family methyltransferase
VIFAVAAPAASQATDDDARDAILESGRKLYSQLNEELLIRHFFGDRKAGFFVDVGCSHWKKHSTTYYLEKHLGWSGIGIDARAEFASDYERHRPGTRFFSYIVTDHSGTQDAFFLAGGLSSTSPDHLKLFPKFPFKSVETKISTITLTELLDANGVEKIDFLSMDIEGGEPRALAAFDIDRFAPELVCIEPSKAGHEFVSDYFASHGYERIDEYLKHDKVNWYFSRKPPSTRE